MYQHIVLHMIFLKKKLTNKQSDVIFYVKLYTYVNMYRSK